MKIFYSPNYDISLFGLESLHPFDCKKYSRAYEKVRRHNEKNASRTFVEPACEVSINDIYLVHTTDYLRKLKNTAYLAQALEFPLLNSVPISVVWDRVVLRPMRWATQGTIMAAREAINSRASINIGGGYHHARSNHGAGFCIYADAAIAIKVLRRDKILNQDDPILYIDVDAHQGDGFASIFMHDKSVKIIDIFNEEIFPKDTKTQERVDYPVKLKSGTGDSEYKSKLEQSIQLAFKENACFSLAIINAGTDVFRKDKLGHLGLSPSGILDRDLSIINALEEQGVPWMMITSGGYTRTSAELIADTINTLLDRGSQ